MTEVKATPQFQIVAVRAPGLDDQKNSLAAFVATGKGNVVQNLFYVHEKQFYNLESPAYITVTVAAGANLHDF